MPWHVQWLEAKREGGLYLEFTYSGLGAGLHFATTKAATGKENKTQLKQCTSSTSNIPFEIVKHVGLVRICCSLTITFDITHGSVHRVQGKISYLRSLLRTDLSWSVKDLMDWFVIWKIFDVRKLGLRRSTYSRYCISESNRSDEVSARSVRVAY